jgi:hypothetical protein
MKSEGQIIASSEQVGKVSPLIYSVTIMISEGQITASSKQVGKVSLLTYSGI